MHIARLEHRILHVSAKTNWFFVRITTDSGLRGAGEASLNGWEPLQEAFLRYVAPGFEGQPVAAMAKLTRVFPHAPHGLVGASVLSAIEQALSDVLAQAAGVPLYAWLGEHAQPMIPVYANINRATIDRSPAGCAASARRALAQGFRGIKIAPFDGVCGEDFAAGWPEQRRRIDAGIARVAAMREAIGPEVDLMVDCHWRFDEATALAVLKELEPVQLRWFECPVSERIACWDALKRLRAAANVRGVLLAGAEMQIGAAGIAPLLERGLFDVVMPDVKYAGGYGEMLRIAALAHRHGVACSPHNPTGPVCNFASMHLMAASANFSVLEFQLGESDLYFDVVGGKGPQLIEGRFAAPPDVPGLGLALDDAVLAAHPYQPVPPGIDPRLG
jgi:galactonate dehydratase